jgi:hypothetical protein
MGMVAVNWRRRRSVVLCFRQLHDAGIRRHPSRSAMAFDRTYDGDEWRAVVRLVHSRDFRGHEPNAAEKIAH